MDSITIRYSVAAAVILATVTIAVSAMAESGQYQPPARPVESSGRLPAVIQLEQTLNRNGVSGLNNVNGQPAQAAPVAQTVQPQAAPVVLTPPPATFNPPALAPVRRATVIAPAIPPMIKVAAPAFADTPPNADGTPAQEAAMLYAPPVRAPWWGRLRSSRGCLYAMAFCLIAVPAAAFTASSVMGRRREERDLALYD
ncbi:MAG: hypothetical protein NTY59_16615 [Alphaproteobacteria bacterium]|nr:hypothetical protein [Alphaproteobacteria bacterium]